MIKKTAPEGAVCFGLRRKLFPAVNEGFRFCLRGLFIYWANAVDNLKVIVLSEIQHEPVSHWFDFAESSVDKYSFLAVVVAGANVGGIFHLAFSAECGHDAA